MRIVLDPPQLEQTAHLMAAMAHELDAVESSLVTRPLPETPADIAAAVRGLLASAERTVASNAHALRNEAAQLEIRALVAQGVGQMPTGPRERGKSWLERLTDYTATVDHATVDVLERFIKAAKPVRVKGFWRGSSWLKANRRSRPGQAKFAGRIGWFGKVLTVLGAATGQLDEDAGKRLPGWEKLVRAATAGGLVLGESAAHTVGAEVFIGIPAVASLIPEVALLGVPGVGEIAAVLLIGAGVGYLADRFLMPTVKKDVFKIEQAVGHDVLKAATTVEHAGSAAIHGVGNAAHSTVHAFKTGFGLWG